MSNTKTLLVTITETEEQTRKISETLKNRNKNGIKKN